jgi:hypothetical protein
VDGSEQAGNSKGTPNGKDSDVWVSVKREEPSKFSVPATFTVLGEGPGTRVACAVLTSIPNTAMRRTVSLKRAEQNFKSISLLSAICD